jgi:hypothetical protein
MLSRQDGSPNFQAALAEVALVTAAVYAKEV